VFKKGGDFTSIQEAIDSITVASSINPFIILVGPGIFIENQIIGKEFVNITGAGSYVTIINQLNTTIPLILGTDGFSIHKVKIQGNMDPGIPIIYYQSTGNSPDDIFELTECYLSGASTKLQLEGSAFTPLDI
jgi:hypothetical protein